MTCSRLRILAAGAILFSMTGHPLPANAQKTTLPPGVLAASPDKSMTKNQLRMATNLGRKAIEGFQAASSDESVPIDEDVRQAARNTYALIRSARHGLELSLENKKFPDPVDQLALKRLTDAWNISRYPVDKETWAVPRREYLSTSVRELSRALQIVDQVLILLP